MEKRYSKLAFILAGIANIVFGAVAYSINLNPVGAIILVVMGISIIIGGIIDIRREELVRSTIDSLGNEKQH